MRVKYNFVICLLVFVLVRESMSVLADSHTRHTSAVHPNRDVTHNSETPLHENREFVKKLISKRLVKNEKARKYSDLTIENGVLELNRSSQQRPHNKSQDILEDIMKNLKASQSLQMVDNNNGLLGTSGDEDSAKWATSEIKMIPANGKETQSQAIQNNKSIQFGVILKNNPITHRQTNETFTNLAHSYSRAANNTDLKVLRPFSDIKMQVNTTKAKVNPHAVNNDTVVKPYFAHGFSTKVGNDTTSKVTVDKTNFKAVQYNVQTNNVTVSLEKIRNEGISPTAGILLQLNSTSNESSPLKSSEATKDAEEKAPSLSINITTLRKGQSFDLQMPASTTPEGTFQDNHLHLAPQMTFSSEYVSDKVQNYSSDFLNETLNTVNEEELENEKVLQKLNSDIATRMGEHLTRKVNSSASFFDKAFREETPAGRTFADKILEDVSNQVLPNLKPKQQDQQVEQDDTLARALNQSSVSSVIFSANDAISSSDLKSFSKKSTQGSVDTRHKGPRFKRSSFFHSLAGHHGRHKKVDTESQVINMGNHLLWFGGQGAADANGFPRHDTATEDPQYNINSYMSNYLNSDDEKEGASTTKGYKALQNALSYMESSQGVADPSFQYSIPAGNKEMHDSSQEQATTNVVIQDNAGKPVYQGTVNIVKVNNSKSNDNITAKAKPQNQDVSMSYEKEDFNKSSGNYHAEQDLPRATSINNQSVSSDTNTTSSRIDGDKEVNQTNSVVGMGHDHGNNLTLSQETVSDEMPTKEVKGISQDEKMQSEYQDQQQASSGAQPSAIIKQVKTNSNEPETYHIVVNDARKKITDANGHVTVIISGPTASQATMPSENTLIIPQTKSIGFSSDNSNVSSSENIQEALGNAQSSLIQADYLSHSLNNGTQGVTSQTLQAASNVSPNVTNVSPLPLHNEALSALKISEGIEGQLNKAEPQMERDNQDQEASSSESKQSNPSPNTESKIQEGHHFVKIGQDLSGGVDGFQIEEVSRPDIQEEQREESENPVMEPGGGKYLEGLEKSLAEQSQDVPTLNIVLDPSQKFGSSLSVGGKIVPIASGKPGAVSTQFTSANGKKLDCHTDPKNGKTTLTILTCQKKQSLPHNPISFSGQNGAYLGVGQVSGGPSLQLDQVMNVLNDQVKATINKEMKSESNDIQKMLTGMTAPTSTLMDVDETSSQMVSPQRSSMVGPDEPFTSLPEDEERSKWSRRHSHHRRKHYFGFPFSSGFLNHRAFLNHAFLPHRQHFWGVHGHSSPFVVMAHKDHSGEGYWDYQHNIFIPHEEDDDDDDDDEEEEDNNEKHLIPWNRQARRKGNWFMPHPPFHHSRLTPFTNHDLFHLRLPTLFGRSGPWMPPKFQKQEQGAKRTAVVHKTVRGDRDTCRPIIEGPSPPLKGEWEYLGKVLCSCPCRLSDTEW